jgi:hypothetical protein
MAFSEAAATGTAEALEAYLNGHPEGASAKTAREQLDSIQYRTRVGVSDLRVEPVNLGGNPEGPMDGWGVFANIVNEGHRTLSVIEIKIDLLDAAGAASGPANTWWAVTPDLSGYPTPEAMKEPLAPSASRAFRWTTGAVPEGWSEKVTLRVSQVRFEY